MTTHKPKAAGDDDELNELFEGLGTESKPKPTKSKPAAAAKKAKLDAKAAFDPLADLESQLDEEKAPRPHTPRIREAAHPKASPGLKRTATNTPPPPHVETATRKSAESTGSYHATPSATSSEPQHYEKLEPAQTQTTSGGGGGGWWGGILSTATAAMKTAEAAVKEIQQNEEARKWADQVRGNVGALRGLGDELRHRALPSLTTILHTLAPPISSHERLLIHITHDLVGYPSLDPLVYAVFNRVMAQVEGGDLVVLQRGQEFGAATPQQSTAGWRDGPWWRVDDGPGRDLGIVAGLVEGTKLCRANAEGYANDYFASKGGVEAARQRALEPVSESNPVRSSDIFLSVQAISVKTDKQQLFAGSAGAERKGEEEEDDDEEEEEETVLFAVYILDPVHDISYSAVSQAVPAQWIHWLDASASSTPQTEEDEEFEEQFGRVPEEIREIIETGGVDPREWVAEWVEEVLSLSVGMVAQRYVARRMGVGESRGAGLKGKQKVESVMAEGGGEAARAGLI
ncbi:maintenance of telomere capping protein 1 [Podospora australis]|uniref:Maintenance of telomere capping protein 1 n=1 Tax=Podospora australis TaxID=1536484 RepID=A0AAN6WUI4_9PEZI|nr:maintenance of telomere capping protein 1 [Podospora australis]